MSGRADQKGHLSGAPTVKLGFQAVPSELVSVTSRDHRRVGTEMISIYSLDRLINQESSFRSQFHFFVNLNQSVWPLDTIFICRLTSLAWTASSSGT